MSNLLTIHDEINQENTDSTFEADRRQQHANQNMLWDKLNLSQQYSVCSLGQFGYILTYVRILNDKTLAILKLGSKLATINEAGDINISPYINFRL